MNLAILGGLIGLSLSAYAVLLGVASWRTASDVPAPEPYQRVQSGNVPADPQQVAGTLMFFGFILLCAAGNRFYYCSAVPLWAYVFAALGGLLLAGGAAWYGYLRRKKQQEPAQFWNQMGTNNR